MKKMEKRNKIQRMLNRLDGKNEATLKVIADFDASVAALRDKLDKDITAATLDEVNKKINQLRKNIDLSPLLKATKELQSEFKQNALQTLQDIEQQSNELRTLITEQAQSLSMETLEVSQKVDAVKSGFLNFSKETTEGLARLNKGLATVSDKISTFADKKAIDKDIKDLRETLEKTPEELKDYTDKTRIELMNLLAQKGGGNMNRNIAIGGNVSVLSKYTDINIKAGANMTISYTTNPVTKYTDITFASSGGGSSVGGTVRSINNISTSQVAGDTAGTDYVYICSAGINLTLPTAVANTNQYTIKNISNSSVLVTTDGSDTIDTDTNIIMPLKFTSVDLISDQTSNWNIT